MGSIAVFWRGPSTEALPLGYEYKELRAMYLLIIVWALHDILVKFEQCLRALDSFTLLVLFGGFGFFKVIMISEVQQ